MAEEDTKFFKVFARRVMKNPVLNRKQMALEILHPKRANVSKEELEARLAESFKAKKSCCVVYGLKAKFGGGRSTGFALIYDSEDYRKKFETIPRLRKMGLKDKPGMARKMKKSLRVKRKKVRGTEKSKQVAATGPKSKKAPK
eukprot:TRINITY_DN0_c3893_g1_i1.p2 TRINITY_DN0_c3893_g1~~TRINITY_DN0_c3893_g1_i1.p2  ORF type:complete len:154 (+),score=63.52 TRINITY_DN0_c3893_g1_i1:36-464(+)